MNKLEPKHLLIALALICFVAVIYVMIYGHFDNKRCCEYPVYAVPISHTHVGGVHRRGEYKAPIQYEIYSLDGDKDKDNDNGHDEAQATRIITEYSGPSHNSAAFVIRTAEEYGDLFLPKRQTLDYDYIWEYIDYIDTDIASISVNSHHDHEGECGLECEEEEDNVATVPDSTPLKLMLIGLMLIILVRR